MEFLRSSDLHLDHCSTYTVDKLFNRVKDWARGRKDPWWFIAGDISSSRHLLKHLNDIRLKTDVKVAFVLGNHDFYHSSFFTVREDVRTFCKQNSERFFFLEDCSPIELSPELCLIGDSGWADGRAGDGSNSSAQLNDFILIEELARARNNNVLFAKLNILGDQSAERLTGRLFESRRFKNVFIVTHAPPFIEASFHRGSRSDSMWMPHYVNLALGDMIRRTVLPDQHIFVFAGHTHGAAHIDITPNIHCDVNDAEYEMPSLYQIDFNNGIMKSTKIYGY